MSTTCNPVLKWSRFTIDGCREIVCVVGLLLGRGDRSLLVGAADRLLNLAIPLQTLKALADQRPVRALNASCAGSHNVE